LDLQDAYQPLGEYMLAPVPSLLIWLQRQNEQAH
jgi:hypothetical protein